MSLPDKVEWWLLRAKKMVAAELIPSKADRRAWVGIYPNTQNPKSPTYKPEVKYHIFHFEVENRTLELTVKRNIYLDKSDLAFEERFNVKDEIELENCLLQWMNDLDKLVLPYFCEYPM